MTHAIVSFKAPPVVEVVVGVALEGLPPEAAALLAAFWKEVLRKHYPQLQQQPPYSPPVEQFPAGPSRELHFASLFGQGMPNARLWAIAAHGQEVVQLQSNWFACNWRQVTPGASPYDRWQRRRGAFAGVYGALVDYLANEGLPAPRITQCEVTYINHVLPGRVWQEHAHVDRVFRIPSDLRTPYRLEQLSAQAQFVLQRDQQPIGRLHVQVLPAYGRDGGPLYVLELLARGAPLDNGVAGALSFLDAGREAIDESFVAVTTPAMHEEWGREL